MYFPRATPCFITDHFDLDVSVLLALLDVKLRVILASYHNFIGEHSVPMAVLVVIATMSEVRSIVRTLVIVTVLPHNFTIVVPSHAHNNSPLLECSYP
jgi:hypothetical protein